MTNEIQPKRKLQNIVQCLFKVKKDANLKSFV